MQFSIHLNRLVFVMKSVFMADSEEADLSPRCAHMQPFWKCCSPVQCIFFFQGNRFDATHVEFFVVYSSSFLSKLLGRDVVCRHFRGFHEPLFGEQYVSNYHVGVGIDGFWISKVRLYPAGT